MTINMRRCSVCKVEKPKTEFHGSNRCKPCDRAYLKAWRQTPKGKATYDRINRRAVLRRYGVTIDDYDEMMASHNGLCAICRRVDPEGRRLAVDHNHATGRVRGLLCRPCNTALGLFGDDLLHLESAVRYLLIDRNQGN